MGPRNDRPAPQEQEIDFDRHAGVEIHRSGEIGIDWRLSTVAEATIKEIDENLRAAEQKSGQLITG